MISTAKLIEFFERQSYEILFIYSSPNMHKPIFPLQKTDKKHTACLLHPQIERLQHNCLIASVNLLISVDTEHSENL